MKRIISGTSLFVVIILFLVFIYPSKVYALTKESSFMDIDNIQDFEVEGLSFINIYFNDYSLTSTQAFGLSGKVINSSSNVISYSTIVYYYDINYNLIAKGTNISLAGSGISDFNQMSNLSVLGEHNISEIYYCRLIIDIYDNILDESNVKSLPPSKNYEYGSYDYVIDKYDVNIIVNENNTFDITETITAYFNVPKHGIFRTIPLKNTITRLDGTTSTNRVRVKNVTVSDEYTISKEYNNYIIKIGSANRTFTDEKTYVIKYTYNLGKDPVKDYDELYYNIIGNEWDTVIGNVTFSITMPKDFDSSKLGFSSGEKGSIDNSKIKYNVSENKITGSYDGVLAPKEALTVRCELPEGYFVNAKLTYIPLTYIMFIIPILGLIIAFALWFKYGRDDKIIETVEFYPPQGFNSLDVGFLYKGRAENKDVTSLLIFLANKGYIKIINKEIDLNTKKVGLNQDSKNSAKQKIIELQNKIDEEKINNPSSKKIKYYENMLDIYKNIDTPIDYEQYGLKSSINKLNRENSFLIKKLKDYDGDNLSEQWFMEGLFEYGRTETTDKILYNNFYITKDRILSNINNKENKNKIFEKNTLGKSILVVLLMILSIFAIVAIPTMEYDEFGEFGTTLFLCAFYIPFFAISIFAEMPLLARIFFLSITVFQSFFAFSTMPIAEAITNDRIYLFGLIIGILCLIGMTIFFKLMPKRTKYGNEMLGKIMGFKNFLETAEKDKLEAMVLDNPNYFYDILPFTYVLGVSDKWIKKFETISMKAPNWYDSSDAFDFVTFGSSMTSTMMSLQDVMSSSPYSGSGGGGSGGSGGSSGGSSGGGSSGGGSGGGGGGSW